MFPTDIPFRPTVLALALRYVNENPDDLRQDRKACLANALEDALSMLGYPGSSPEEYGDLLADLHTETLDRLPVFLIGDQPTTCPDCGARTEFTELDNGQQHHNCDNCGYEFLAEDEG